MFRTKTIPSHSSWEIENSNALVCSQRETLVHYSVYLTQEETETGEGHLEANGEDQGPWQYGRCPDVLQGNGDVWIICQYSQLSASGLWWDGLSVPLTTVQHWCPGPLIGGHFVASSPDHYMGLPVFYHFWAWPCISQLCWPYLSCGILRPCNSDPLWHKANCMSGGVQGQRPR